MKDNVVLGHNGSIDLLIGGDQTNHGNKMWFPKNSDNLGRAAYVAPHRAHHAGGDSVIKKGEAHYHGARQGRPSMTPHNDGFEEPVFKSKRELVHVNPTEEKFLKAEHLDHPTGNQRATRRLARRGRYGDNRIASVSRKVADELDDLIHDGKKQRNPRTGLREYNQCKYCGDMFDSENPHKDFCEKEKCQAAARLQKDPSALTHHKIHHKGINADYINEATKHIPAFLKTPEENTRLAEKKEYEKRLKKKNWDPNKTYTLLNQEIPTEEQLAFKQVMKDSNNLVRQKGPTCATGTMLNIRDMLTQGKILPKDSITGLTHTIGAAREYQRRHGNDIIYEGDPEKNGGFLNDFLDKEKITHRTHKYHEDDFQRDPTLEFAKSYLEKGYPIGVRGMVNYRPFPHQVPKDLSTIQTGDNHIKYFNKPYTQREKNGDTGMEKYPGEYESNIYDPSGEFKKIKEGDKKGEIDFIENHFSKEGEIPPKKVKSDIGYPPHNSHAWTLTNYIPDTEEKSTKRREKYPDAPEREGVWHGFDTNNEPGRNLKLVSYKDHPNVLFKKPKELQERYEELGLEPDTFSYDYKKTHEFHPFMNLNDLATKFHAIDPHATKDNWKQHDEYKKKLEENNKFIRDNWFDAKAVFNKDEAKDKMINRVFTQVKRHHTE